MVGHAGKAWGDVGQTLCPLPPKRKAQPEQVLGRGWGLWHQKIGLVAGSKYRQPQGLWPAPSPQPWKLGNSRKRTELWKTKE